MRWSRAPLTPVTAALIFGCAWGDSLGPGESRLTPLISSEASAAKNPGVPGSVKVYCINPTSCFAVAFDFTRNPQDPGIGPSTIFSVFFQNLQGTFPSDGPSTPLNLNRFRFQFTGTMESADFVDAYPIESFSSIGNVQVGANFSWSNDSPVAGVNRDVWVAEIGSGILGCNVPAGNPPLWFTFRTCPSQGLDGWVRVDFILWHAGFDPSRAPVRLHDFVFSFGDGFTPGHYCTLGGEQPETCTVFPYRKSVSP